MYQFLSNSNVRIGNGELKKFCKSLDNNKYNNILFIIDDGFYKTVYWKKCLKELKKNKIKVNFIKIKLKFEPTYIDLEKYRNLSSSFKPDYIIACGGGSCMDLAKSISVLLKNKGSAIRYRGFDKITKKGIKLTLVPTTCGTGSEASYNASLIDTEGMKKMGINGENMFAYSSILDGETISELPYKPALSSIIDTFTHIMEGYVCKNSNLITDLICEQAFKIMIENFDQIKFIKKRPSVALKFLICAHLGGIIQMNSGSGIAAALSYPLSVYFNVPHGIGGGIFLLGVMKFNIKNGYKKYDNLIKYVNKKNKIKNSKELIIYLEVIFKKIGVPSNLNNWGIRSEDLSKLKSIMSTQQIAFDQNPISFKLKKDLDKFLKKYI